MVNVESIQTVYAKIENRPGSLEYLTHLVANHRVNIDAISIETVGATGFARLVTTRPREIVDVLKAANLESYESPTLVVSLVNRPGELLRASTELAAAGINVESLITTPENKIALRTSDNERAAQILRKL